MQEDGNGEIGKEVSPWKEFGGSLIAPTRLVVVRKLLWIVPPIFFAGVIVTFLAAWLVAILHDGRAYISTLGQPPASVRILHSDCELLDVRLRFVLRVVCSGTTIETTIPDIIALRSVPFDKAQSALEAGIATVFNLLPKDDTRCRVLQFSTPVALAGQTGAVCEADGVGLSRQLVVRGLAEMAPLNVLSGIHTDGSEIEALQDASRHAKQNRIGLHADVAALRLSFEILAQSWIATLLGFVGAIAFFFLRVENESDAVDLSVNRLLYSGRRDLSRLIRGTGKDPEVFDKTIAKLEALFAKFDDDNSLDPIFQHLLKIKERAVRATQDGAEITKSTELKNADRQWQALGDYWKSNRN